MACSLSTRRRCRLTHVRRIASEKRASEMACMVELGAYKKALSEEEYHQLIGALCDMADDVRRRRTAASTTCTPANSP